MLKLGIVGTGMMAGIIAEACQFAGLNVHSVLSRSQNALNAFCQKFNIPPDRGFCDSSKFFSDPKLDAVYIATPTSTKEELLRICIQYRKHALIEKPFPDSDVFMSLLSESERLGLVWLDAAHYIHNPFHNRLKQEIERYVGPINRICASFIWPDTDRGQIKFSPELEPYGALGDLGWYPARIISEFIDVSQLETISSFLIKNKKGAIIETNATGYTSDNITFTSSASYRGSVCEQSCVISGEKGQLTVNDFVMPYCGSFVYGEMMNEMTIKIAHGLKPLLDKTEKTFVFTERQHITMLKNFSEYTIGCARENLLSHQNVCINTINLLRNIKNTASSIIA